MAHFRIWSEKLRWNRAECTLKTIGIWSSGCFSYVVARQLKLFFSSSIACFDLEIQSLTDHWIAHHSFFLFQIFRVHYLFYLDDGSCLSKTDSWCFWWNRRNVTNRNFRFAYLTDHWIAHHSFFLFQNKQYRKNRCKQITDRLCKENAIDFKKNRPEL